MTIAAQGSRLETIPRPASAFQRNINLLRELAVTQFKLKYTGSALGYVWSLVKPAMLFGIMYAVFSRLLRAGSNTPEFTVQLLFAIVLWTFFTESTMVAINSVVASAGLIRKAYFPRWIIVVASILTALITFLINSALIIIITVPIGHMHLGVRSLAAPLLLVELLMLIIGLSLLLSSLFVYYRDVGHIWEICTLVLFYGSAIVYPFTVFAHKGIYSQLGIIAGLNPLAQIVEDLRHALVTPGVPWMVSVLGGLYAVPVVLSVGTFALGFYVFHRLTPRFAENL